jgi:hypothetical protein
MVLRVRFFIFLAILLTAALRSFATPTLGEFKQDMIAHKGIVFANAIALLKNFPEHFPMLSQLPEDLRMDFVITYLRTHDAPKVMSLKELQELGYRGEQTMLEKLHAQWGKALKRRPPFIQELNHLEEVYKLRVMNSRFSSMKRSFFNQLLQEVKLMEFVADETDAKVNRGTELGVETKPFDAYHMFKEYYKDELGAEFSKWLEINLYKRANLIFCEEHFKGGK